MASYGDSCQQNSTVMRLASSVLGGSRYIMDPESRAKQVRQKFNYIVFKLFLVLMSKSVQFIFIHKNIFRQIRKNRFFDKCSVYRNRLNILIIYKLMSFICHVTIYLWIAMSVKFFVKKETSLDIVLVSL